MSEFYDLRTRLPADPGLPAFLKEWGWAGAGVPVAGGERAPPPPSRPQARSPSPVATVSERQHSSENTTPATLFPVTLLPGAPRERGLKGVVFVATGTQEELRRAARHPAVDALSVASPLDPVTVRFAAESGVAVELCVGDLLRLRGGNRVRALQRLRRNALLARKAGAHCLLTSGAESRTEVRAPRDLASLGVVAGLGRREALEGVREVPGRILQRRGLR